MVSMTRIPHDEFDRGTRLSSVDVKEGREYIFKWNPYAWSLDIGYESPVKVKITEVTDIVGDVRMEADDGTPLTDYGEHRPQVGGPAEEIEGVADYTDVGTGGAYYPVPGGVPGNP